MIARGPSFASLVATTFDEIRRSGQGHARVLCRLAAVLEELLDRTADPRRRAVLLAQAARLRTAGHRGLRDPVDRDALEAVRARLLGLAGGDAFSAPRHAASG